VDTTHILKIQTELAQRTLRERQFAKYAARNSWPKYITTHLGTRRIDIAHNRHSRCVSPVIADFMALSVDGRAR
jgi:hypothetical protein